MVQEVWIVWERMSRWKSTWHLRAVRWHWEAFQASAGGSRRGAARRTASRERGGSGVGWQRKVLSAGGGENRGEDREAPPVDGGGFQ